MYYCGDVKAVENLHDCISVLTVVSKALKMSRLIARIKILPNEMGLERYGKEPIAFGLNSLICDFSLNDVEGQMDSLEEYIKKTQGVSEIQVMNISRKSVNIK